MSVPTERVRSVTLHHAHVLAAQVPPGSPHRSACSLVTKVATPSTCIMNAITSPRPLPTRPTPSPSSTRCARPSAPATTRASSPWCARARSRSPARTNRPPAHGPALRRQSHRPTRLRLSPSAPPARRLRPDRKRPQTRPPGPPQTGQRLVDRNKCSHPLSAPHSARQLPVGKLLAEKLTSPPVTPDTSSGQAFIVPKPSLMGTRADSLPSSA